MKTALLGGVVGIAVVWLIAALFLYVFQRSFLYHRATTPLPEPASLGLGHMEVVGLSTGDGLSLTAWFAPPPEGAPVIVYFHGNGGTIADRDDKALLLRKAGLGLLLVEWRGYGGNPGLPTEAGLLADGRAALAFLNERNIGPERWVLLGESLGSGVAFQLAAEGPAPAAVVTEGGFTSAVEVGARRYPIFPVRFLMKDRFDSLAVLPRVRVPLLVMHGQRDRVVPPEMGRRLAAAAVGPVETFFPDGEGHVNLLEGQGGGAVLVEFLEKHGILRR